MHYDYIHYTSVFVMKTGSVYVSFQALIDEDRLLSRLEVMGNQLQAYSKVRPVVCCKYLDVCSQNIVPVSPKHVVSSEPNRRRYSKGACILNRGQTQLRDDSQRVPEAGPSGENRGGEEAVGGGGKNTSKSLIHGQTKELCLDMHGALSN